MANKEQTYYQNRMEMLGITDDNNMMTVNNPLAEYPQPTTYKAKKYSEDKQGNIEILYWRLNRDIISWTHYTGSKSDSVTRPRHYTIKRFTPDVINQRVAAGKEEMRYQMPSLKEWNKRHPKEKISPPPYIPESVLVAHEKKEKKETLFLTEGPIKAEYASRQGLFIIGLSSITHHTDKSTDGLHPDIVKIIEDCEVQKVVILWDGDCLNISKTALLRREELTKRPVGFYAAAKTIQKLLLKIKFKKTREKVQVWFQHPKSHSLEGHPKGIDDVLMAAIKQEKLTSVIHDCQKLGKKSPFFYRKRIDNGLSSLYKYFGLDNYEDFYRMHQQEIEDTEFLFRGSTVRWNDSENEVQMLAPAWAKELRWIGDEFFWDMMVPTADGKTERQLKKFSKSTLEDRFKKGFQEKLQFFHGFVNIPDHFNYRQVVEKFGKQYYNRYFPFRWEPAQGKWPHIEKLMKHIFGEHMVKCAKTCEEYLSWHMGLDYVQILLTEPIRKLPVLVLYSEENNTGKSTFGHLLADIFSDNVVEVGNSALTSEFNETYADKLVCVVEETLLDRKKDTEKIKALSTAFRMLVNPKGVRQFSIDFFCKFIFNSNNRRMIYLTKHDERFWILEIPQLTEDDPTFRDKMKAEIPAFIQFLKERELATPKQSRMHFHNSLIKTEAFFETVKVNEPAAATDLRDQIKNMFLDDHGLKEIRMTMKNIREEFFNKATTEKWIREILKDYLDVDLLRNKKGQAKVERGTYSIWRLINGTLEKEQVQYRGRPYIFEREHFVKVDEVDAESYKALRKQDEAIERPELEVGKSSVQIEIEEINDKIQQLELEAIEAQKAEPNEAVIVRRYFQNRQKQLKEEKGKLQKQVDGLPF